MNGHDDSSKYDPNTVIAASNEKLAKNDIEGGQYIFQSALFEWVDDACEGGVSGLTEAIATLWLAYANFLIAAQQYKTAGDIYEEAIRCPVTRHVGRIYAEYARFAVERNKRKTAQDVYIRALVSENDDGLGAVQDEQDRDFLWNEFLEMMKTTNPTLTLEALKEAVEQKHNAPSQSPDDETPDTIISDHTASNISTTATGALSATSEPATKRARTEAVDAASTAIPRTHVVTEESVQELASKFFQEWNVGTTSIDRSAQKHLGLPPEIATAWMILDGSHPPTIPDIMLFEPSPPKLSDPTAKDILGVELAAQLIECLLSPSGGVILEVCRGLWILQALKEQDARRRIQSYDQNLCQENERLEGELEARLSVAGGVADAVRQMNDRERQSFRADAVQKRQSLITDLAWEYRQLLYWQQTALAKLQVPGTEEGPTVDSNTLHLQTQICRYLHSAFYIRNRMGVEPHETVLKNQLKKLQKELSSSDVDNIGNTTSASPKFAGRISNAPPPRARHSPLPPPATKMASSYPVAASQATMPSQILLPPPPPPPPPLPQYNFPMMTMQQQQQQQQQPSPQIPIMGMMNPFPYTQQQQQSPAPAMMSMTTSMQQPILHPSQQQQLLPPRPPPPPPGQPGPYPGQQQQQQHQYPYYH